MSIHYINYKVVYKTLLDLITLILMISLALYLLPIGLVWGAKVLLQKKIAISHCYIPPSFGVNRFKKQLLSTLS